MSIWSHIKSRLILTALTPVLALGMVASLARYIVAIPFSPQRGWKVAVAVDDLGNVAGNGHLGQTISSRAAYAAIAGKTWGKIVCKALDTLNPGHCANAILEHEQNLNRPVAASTEPKTPPTAA